MPTTRQGEIVMMNSATPINPAQQENFLKSLSDFTKEHRAVYWSGPLSQFLEQMLPKDPQGAARTSHQYMWDMIRWTRKEDENGNFRSQLFADELFGVDEAIERVVDYFKAAAAGSEVGRRLLLLLGPPAGGGAARGGRRGRGRGED